MKVEITRITFEKDGFIIGKALVQDGNDKGRIISIKGNFPPDAEPSLWYEGEPKTERHPRYGEQVLLRNVIEIKPDAERGVLRWLERKGVPFRIAVGLLRHGVKGIEDRCLDIDCLREAGATDEEANAIKSKLSEFDWETELGKIPGFGAKRIRNLGEWAVETGKDMSSLLRENAYQLLEAPGVGWSLADAAALGLGMRTDDPRRLAAAPVYVLARNEQEGHTYMQKDEMLTATSEMLDLPSHRIVDAIASHDVYTPIVMNGDRVWRSETHKAEQGAAWKLNVLRDTPSEISQELSAALEAYDWENGCGFEPTQEQRAAVAHAVTHKISVLTGGPGTGKSTMTKAIVDVFASAVGEQAVVLLAPTGKAAKRLSETTGRRAVTIHSALYKGLGDDVSLAVVDEASMLDTAVAAWLLNSLPETAHVLFVGDDNQLPSVGAGRVLYDIQQSCVPVFRLTKTHRNDGAILATVYGVLSGSVPEINNNDGVYLFEVPDADDIPSTVGRIVLQEQGNTIKVIAPQRSRKTGEGCGWNTINRALQALLNPSSPGKSEIRWYGDVLREGDLLLWTENNKELGLVNGDDVSVERIKGSTITLSNGHSVDIEDMTAVHGWSSTTHKAQGSEYDVVVFVCHSSHQWMLTQRNVYTALSRAKKRLYIIGERSALEKASRSTRDAHRNTALTEFMNTDQS